MQHFNLSKTLAASINKVSAWVSSALLMTLLLATMSLQRTSTAALLNVPQTLAATQSLVAAIAVAAAVLLIASVPLSRKLTQKGRHRNQQKGHSSETVSRQTASAAESLRAVSDGQETQQQGDVNTQSGEAKQVSNSLASSETKSNASGSDGGERMLSALQKADDTAAAQSVNNDASTLTPDLSGSEAASAPDADSLAGTSHTEEDQRKKRGFFRDVSADCTGQRQPHYTQKRPWHRGVGSHRHFESVRTPLQLTPLGVVSLRLVPMS